MLSIDEFMSSLAKRHPVFISRGHKKHVAETIKAIWPSATLEEDYKGPETAGQKVHFFIRDREVNIAINFRYKTNRFELDERGVKLTDHGAQDQGRYDFVSDLAKLEQISDEVTKTIGWAIILTNDAGYWNPLDENTPQTVDHDFRISETKVLNKSKLEWLPNASEGTRKNRDRPVFLNGVYKCEWKNYSSFPDQKNGTFRYLGLIASSASDGFNAHTASLSTFDPSNNEDGRTWILRNIAQRRGQQKFRDELLKAYSDSCAITGCEVLDVLEAAHISPFRGDHTNHVTNGLLLRADIHTLFDCRKISINPETMKIWVSPEIQNSEYQSFHGKELSPPIAAGYRPSEQALKAHYNECIIVHPE